MKIKARYFVLPILFVICIMCYLSVSAMANTGMEVVLTDVTNSDLTTLKGEAKVKVSVKGIAGSVSASQFLFKFDGDLKYKSIQFLKGKNEPPQCVQISPNAALANSTGTLIMSIVSLEGIMFDDEITDLFILTFTGDEGDSVTLELDDLSKSYCTVNGNDIHPDKYESVNAYSSDRDNEGKKASIRLVMDVVDDFTAGVSSEGYSNSGVELKITSETIPGYIVYTVLNNTLVSKGGHRENVSLPTFTVENTVLADGTYTVELSGLGYLPYKLTGVTFDDVIEITNSDFVPGDINSDGKVDILDKKMCENLVAQKQYQDTADFNRDEVIDRYDLRIFNSINEDNSKCVRIEAEYNKDGTLKKIKNITEVGGVSEEKPDEFTKIFYWYSLDNPLPLKQYTR